MRVRWYRSELFSRGQIFRQALDSIFRLFWLLILCYLTPCLLLSLLSGYLLPILIIWTLWFISLLLWFWSLLLCLTFFSYFVFFYFLLRLLPWQFLWWLLSRFLDSFFFFNLDWYIIRLRTLAIFERLILRRDYLG